MNVIKPATNFVRKVIYETYLSKYFPNNTDTSTSITTTSITTTNNNSNELIYHIQQLVNNSKYWHLPSFNMLLQLYLILQISTPDGTLKWYIRNHTNMLQPFNIHMTNIQYTANTILFEHMLINTLYAPEAGLKYPLLYKSYNNITNKYEINVIDVDLNSSEVTRLGVYRLNNIYTSLGLGPCHSDDPITTSTSTASASASCCSSGSNNVMLNYFLCPLQHAHNCTVMGVKGEAIPTYLGTVSVIHLPPLSELVEARDSAGASLDADTAALTADAFLSEVACAPEPAAAASDGASLNADTAALTADAVLFEVDSAAPESAAASSA